MNIEDNKTVIALTTPKPEIISGLNIFTPTPKLAISEWELEDLLFDPVEAAWRILGAKLDVFQRCRLRYAWFIPRFMDSSGFSTGKTYTMWLCSVLRSILIPDHWSCVIYQKFSTGQESYWRYFNDAQMRSPLFRSQVGRIETEDSDANKKGTRRGAAVWTCSFRNGSIIFLPAPDHVRGAPGMASLRFNDLYFDEWTKIDNMESGSIDDQLVGRGTRASFNQDHPIWCNHQYFLATAEDTMHPGYERYLIFKKAVARGDTKYHLCSYSYKDHSDLLFSKDETFAKRFRVEAVMQDHKKKFTLAHFLQEDLGVWSKNGKGWYTLDLMDRAFRLGESRNVQPITTVREDPLWNDERKRGDVKYFLGLDPAKAEQKKADDGAMVVLRAAPAVPQPGGELCDWHMSYIWAYKVRKADAGQWAGLIHRKHKDFGFSRIVMDIGGGGDWIRPELGKAEQIIQGERKRVVPIGCIEDAQTMSFSSEFILSMFKPSDHWVDKLWGDRNIRHSSKIIEAGHKELLEAFSHDHLAFPVRHLKRDPMTTRDWSDEKRHASQMLTLMANQFMKIAVQTNNDGTTFTNGHDAMVFSSKDRKDFAYAGMFAFVALLEWLKTFGEDADYQDNTPTTRPRIQGVYSHMPAHMGV